MFIYPSTTRYYRLQRKNGLVLVKMTHQNREAEMRNISTMNERSGPQARYENSESLGSIFVNQRIHLPSRDRQDVSLS